MSKKDTPQPGGEIIVYQAEDGGSRIRVLLARQTGPSSASVEAGGRVAGMRG